MGEKRGLVVLLGIAAVLLAAAAVAAAADSRGPDAAPHRKVCIVVNAGQPVTLDLEDLRDGESRSITSGDRELVATRKGESIEVVSVGKDGTRRVLVDTLAVDDGTGHACVVHGKDGERSHRVVVRTMTAGDAANPVVTEGDEPGGGPVVIKRICVRGGDGLPGELEGAATGSGCAVGAASEMSAYRCKDDEATVTVPKSKEPLVAPACPVCAKAMEKVKAHVVVVRTTIDENPAGK